MCWKKLTILLLLRKFTVSLQSVNRTYEYYFIVSYWFFVRNFYSFESHADSESEFLTLSDVIADAELLRYVVRQKCYTTFIDLDSRFRNLIYAIWDGDYCIDKMKINCHVTRKFFYKLIACTR